MNEYLQTFFYIEVETLYSFGVDRFGPEPGQRFQGQGPVLETARVQKRITSLLRSRFKSLKYVESIEKAPELTVTFENSDLFLIDMEKHEALGVAGGEILEVGNQIVFQFGYLDPSSNRIVQPFTSPVRKFTINQHPNSDPGTIVVKAVSSLNETLATVIGPRSFSGADGTGSKISEVARQVLIESGFNENQIKIQDSRFRLPEIVRGANETNLTFLYRLARSLNYFFYVSPEDVDGVTQEVAHFHKAGWDLAKQSDDPQLVLSQDEQQTFFGSAGPGTPLDPALGLDSPTGNVINLSPKYGESGNGNFTPSDFTLIYRNPFEGRSLFTEEGQSEVEARRTFQEDVAQIKTWKVSYEPNQKPKSAVAAGVDVRTGQAYSETVETENKQQNSLARKTDFAKERERNPNEGRDSLLVARRSGVGTANRLYIRTSNQTKDEAQNTANSVLEDAQSDTVKLSVTTLGRPDILAGTIGTIKGLKKYDGKYLIREVTHDYGSGGFTTTIGGTTDGVDAGASKGDAPNQRDEEQIRITKDGRRIRVQVSNDQSDARRRQAARDRVQGSIGQGPVGGS